MKSTSIVNTLFLMDSMIVTTLLAATRYFKIIRPFHKIKKRYVVLYHVLLMTWIFGATVYENFQVGIYGFINHEVRTYK